MRIVYLDKFDAFYTNNANSRKSLLTWKQIVSEATWRNKQDVFKDFPRAKMIKNNRARFEIVHNTYRLIAQIHYEENYLEIRFIGTHNEYDRIYPTTI